MKNKDACLLKSRIDNSVELLNNADCLAMFDVYSIRFHDANQKGMHFDYAIGNVNLDFCVDFIIPRGLEKSQTVGYTRHEYKGKEGHVIPPDTVKNFIPTFPARGQKIVLLFMQVHPRSVLVSKIGQVHEISEGDYGAGEWFVIEKGEAKVIKRDDGFLFMIGDRYFRLFPYKKGYLIEGR